MPPVGILKTKPVSGQQPRGIRLQESSSFSDAGSSFYEDSSRSGRYARNYDEESSPEYSDTESAVDESSASPSRSFDRLESKNGRNARYHSHRHY